jgi:hypothetical protein
MDELGAAGREYDFVLLLDTEGVNSLEYAGLSAYAGTVLL